MTEDGGQLRLTKASCPDEIALWTNAEHRTTAPNTHLVRGREAMEYDQFLPIPVRKRHTSLSRRARIDQAGSIPWSRFTPSPSGEAKKEMSSRASSDCFDVREMPAEKIVTA